MFDYENEIYFCICGKKVDLPEPCGEQECINNFQVFQENTDKFFKLMETEGIWKGFETFQKLDVKQQVGIFFELEDELMLLFLQALGPDKVLTLLQNKNPAFRFRFLELIDPLLEKSIVDDFKNIHDLSKEELKEFLLQIIDITLQSVEDKG